MEWSEVTSKQLKLVSAGIGAGALIAMGALGVTFSDVSSAQPEPAPPGPVPTEEATVGETSTECEVTTPEGAPAEDASTVCASPEPETSVASPEVSAPGTGLPPPP
jgi:hypothetical protein